MWQVLNMEYSALCCWLLPRSVIWRVFFFINTALGWFFFFEEGSSRAGIGVLFPVVYFVCP